MNSMAAVVVSINGGEDLAGDHRNRPRVHHLTQGKKGRERGKLRAHRGCFLRSATRQRLRAARRGGQQRSARSGVKVQATAGEKERKDGTHGFYNSPGSSDTSWKWRGGVGQREPQRRASSSSRRDSIGGGEAKLALISGSLLEKRTQKGLHKLYRR